MKFPIIWQVCQLILFRQMLSRIISHPPTRASRYREATLQRDTSRAPLTAANRRLASVRRCSALSREVKVKVTREHFAAVTVKKQFLMKKVRQEENKYFSSCVGGRGGEKGL
jgi:hypothetical protein